MNHVFTLTVKSSGTKRSARLAVLSAFAARNPDGCECHVSDKYNQKKAYLAGSMSGVQLGFELVLRNIEHQMKELKLERGFAKQKKWNHK